MANKNITQVEEIEVLDGTEKVFVNSNGSLKQIKPENAKFAGNGGGVIYEYSEVQPMEASSSETQFTTQDGESVTIQMLYDDLCKGPVIIHVNDTPEVFSTIINAQIDLENKAAKLYIGNNSSPLTLGKTPS